MACDRIILLIFLKILCLLHLFTKFMRICDPNLNFQIVSLVLENIITDTSLTDD